MNLWNPLARRIRTSRPRRPCSSARSDVSEDPPSPPGVDSLDGDTRRASHRSGRDVRGGRFRSATTEARVPGRRPALALCVIAVADPADRRPLLRPGSGCLQICRERFGPCWDGPPGLPAASSRTVDGALRACRSRGCHDHASDALRSNAGTSAVRSPRRDRVTVRTLRASQSEARCAAPARLLAGCTAAVSL
jgi:hypothetical protein